LDESNIVLSTEDYIHAAYIYLWDGKYELSDVALAHIKDKHHLEKTKIKADICYYTGKYACSLELFKKLYDLSHDINDGIKLVYSYLHLGYLDEAKQLYFELFKANPKNKELKNLKGKFSKQESKRLKIAKEKYEKNKNLKTLTTYCSLLYTAGFKQKTVDVLKVYNKKYANTDSLLLEAKYLSWMGKLKDALQILEGLSTKDNLKVKFRIGQIASWDNNFEKAKKYLNEVIASSKDKALLYEAKKALAYVYKWEKKNEKAKKIFTQLFAEKKNDDEVIEALMELNGDYKGLIKRYEKKVASGGGSGNKKRLSELYFQNNQQDKAIEALKAHLLEKPKDLEATKNLALMLIDKKEYYSGFGNLEFYAAQKNDANSSLLLAQNYYWQGFSQEAVDVLDKLLKKYPEHKEALELRAKILKVSPRFTRSNSGATVNEYFDQVGLKQLEIADALYFNGHHAASLMYYENYLSEEPTNHDVRLRYAFALENAGEFAKAEGEFYLMFWTHKTDEIKYHYAYNLMMNKKLDKAQEVFLTLKKQTFKKITPGLKSFIDGWKKDWESQIYTAYKKNYTDKIVEDEEWALSNQQAFKDANFISVGLYDVVSKKDTLNNTYIVKFYQEVTTNLGTRKGNTTLHISCVNHQRECQITQENFVPSKYQKFVSLEPILKQRLKDIKVFRKRPYLLDKIKRQKKKL